MLLLKKKRYQEQLLDKTENQISNLERMVSAGRLLWAASGPLRAWCKSLFLEWVFLESPWLCGIAFCPLSNEQTSLNRTWAMTAP